MAYPFRFLTQKSMAAIKHDDAKRNSRIKRGAKDAKHTQHVMCGCDFTNSDPTCHFVSEIDNHLEPKQQPLPPKPKKR